MTEVSGTNDKELSNSRFQADLIEILYSIVLAASFVVILPLTNGVPSFTAGFLYWIANPLANILTILTVFFAYSIVITSWLAYHRSVDYYPIRGNVRFVIDITIAFLYYLMFILITDFDYVLGITAGIFVLYTLWTVWRVYEYRKNPGRRELWSRVLKAFVFAVLASCIWLVDASFPNINPYQQGILLILSYLNLAAYRFVSRFKARVDSSTQTSLDEVFQTTNY